MSNRIWGLKDNCFEASYLRGRFTRLRFVLVVCETLGKSVFQLYFGSLNSAHHTLPLGGSSRRLGEGAARLAQVCGKAQVFGKALR